MTKTQILEEIKKTAEANGGKPLGSRRLHEETGIVESDWIKHWPRFNDAIREAGYSPNTLSTAYPEEELLATYAELALELADRGQLPTDNDLIFKGRNTPGFPSVKTFARLGAKAALVRRLHDFCLSHGGYEPVRKLCENYNPRALKISEEPQPNETADGFVYLVKAGRYYKIGKSNAPGRRQYELGVQLPEKLNLVHEIRTDDPSGVEKYWHTRFQGKRKNGEWFDLDRNDIAAFKRRKNFM